MRMAVLRSGNLIKEKQLTNDASRTADLILSCDWGTTAFRLRLVEISSSLIIAEILSDEGILKMFDLWKSVADRQAVSREVFFLQQLKKQIARLSGKLAIALDDVPVIVSGMASSSIGIKELPYAQLPFLLTGEDAIVECIAISAEMPNKVMVVSGVRSDSDVMRGEETQVIGLALLTGENHDEPVMCIMPGTHSKHVLIESGRIVGFETYMTGEIFQVLASHSILADAVFPKRTTNTLTPDECEGFSKGVLRSGTSNILHSLFSVRTNQLFDTMPAEQNFFYLSGLMIGTELRRLIDRGVGHIKLCSGNNLFQLYKLGIHVLGMSKRTSLVAPAVMERAVIEGHIRLLGRMADKL